MVSTLLMDLDNSKFQSYFLYYHQILLKLLMECLTSSFYGEVLKCVYNTLQLPTSTLNKCIYQIWPLTKAHKLPFTHVHKHYANAFELLHMNLQMFLIVATNGAKYCLLIVDYFSIYQQMYFLSTKSNVVSAFHYFIQMVERHFCTKYKSIQTYDGKSFSLSPKTHLSWALVIELHVYTLQNKMVLWKLYIGKWQKKAQPYSCRKIFL